VLFSTSRSRQWLPALELCRLDDSDVSDLTIGKGAKRRAPPLR
jgi:hypothetical protein